MQGEQNWQGEDRAVMIMSLNFEINSVMREACLGTVWGPEKGQGADSSKTSTTFS